MGVQMLLECAQCGWNKEFFVGGGMRDCEMKTLSNVIPKHKYWEYKAALAKMQPGGFSIDRRLGQCKKCAQICAVPVVSFLNINGTKRDITGVCQECESEIDFFDKTENIPCPSCSGVLTACRIGLWD